MGETPEQDSSSANICSLQGFLLQNLVGLPSGSAKTISHQPPSVPESSKTVDTQAKFHHARQTPEEARGTVLGYVRSATWTSSHLRIRIPKIRWKTFCMFTIHSHLLCSISRKKSRSNVMLANSVSVPDHHCWGLGLASCIWQVAIHTSFGNSFRMFFGGFFWLHFQ